MHGLPESERAKIALFTNVAIPDVISLPDAKTIYEIPLLLRREGLGERVVSKLDLPVREADLSEWQQVVDAQKHPRQEVKIAMVGKYTDFADSYKSLNEALIHAGIQTRTQVHIVYVDAEVIRTKWRGYFKRHGCYFSSRRFWLARYRRDDFSSPVCARTSHSLI